MTIIRWPGKNGSCVFMVLIPFLSSASAQEPGFISIDCGATSNSTDPTTGIQWTTDAPYVSTGINQIAGRDVVSVVNQDQLQTLRYFPPDRNKHCYILPVTGNTSYLVRAVFFHGGFQSAVDNAFSITINSHIIDSPAFTDSDIDTVLHFEYIVGTDVNSDTISLCLLPLGTNAFINTLELRPFARGMYDVDYRTKYLKSTQRLNCGAAIWDPVIRYPDDVYDRVWFSPDYQKLINGKTTRNITRDEVQDNPPLPVLQSAWIEATSFWYIHTPPGTELTLTTTFYVNLFFAEVQTAKATDMRSFSVSLNGQPFYPNLTLGTDAYRLSSKTLNVTSDGANFTFQILPGATLGPVLNGAEYYAIIDWIDSSTDSRDVNALGVLKTSLGLNSWTGDPCLPVAYNWITCDKGSVPRVTAIKLSKSSLTGTIPASIANMTALTDLWLDNNRIQGAIPDLSKLTKLRTLHLQNNFMSGGIPTTLASIPLLTELFLQNNNFSGPIPEELSNKNGLNLQTSGNSNLCTPTANCSILPVVITNSTDTNNSPDGGGNSKSGGSGTVVGGIVGGVIAAIIVIGLLMWFFCRKPRTQLTLDTGSIPTPTPNTAGYWRQLIGAPKAMDRDPETGNSIQISSMQGQPPDSEAVPILDSSPTEETETFSGACLDEAGKQYEKPRTKRVNDHLYELLGTRQKNNPPLFDLVLFHGPTRDEDWEEAYWQDWMTSDGQFFPHFLLEDFPECRIHSVSYDARINLEETDSQLEYYLLVENLESDIIITPEIGQTCPVVLVGHSIGGNVINSFILKLFRSPVKKTRKYETFLQNLRGIFYFSTPQLGMDIGALVAAMGLPDHTTGIGPLYESLQRLNKVLARMTEEMKAWYNQSGTIVHVAYVWEGQLTPFMPDLTCSCGELENYFATKYIIVNVPPATKREAFR